jgi:hypothetical protein
MCRPPALSSGIRISRRLIPECSPFGKLNRSNRFRVCDWHHNYFPILDLKIREGSVSDRVWSKSDHQISLEQGSQCSRHWRQTADTDCRHSLVNMLINFEQFDFGLQRHDSVVKTSMMKFTPKDLLCMILMPKFWLYWTNLFSNQLIR